jgi:hypothetical protein
MVLGGQKKARKSPKIIYFSRKSAVDTGHRRYPTDAQLSLIDKGKTASGDAELEVRARCR